MMEADAQAAAAAAGGASGGPPPALPPAAAAVANPAQLRPRVLAAMRAAVRGYRAATGDASGELKLTVLVCWPGGTDHEVAADGLHAADDHEAPPQGCTPAAAAADVFVHVSPLPPRPAPPVKVVMRGALRQNAAAKDSEWVRQRKALEVGLPAGVNEVRGERARPQSRGGLGVPAVQWCRGAGVDCVTIECAAHSGLVAPPPPICSCHALSCCPADLTAGGACRLMRRPVRGPVLQLLCRRKRHHLHRRRGCAGGDGARGGAAGGTSRGHPRCDSAWGSVGRHADARFCLYV